MGDVIRMQDVTRSTLPRSGEDQAHLGFCKALALVKLLMPCNLEETKASLQNWLDANALSTQEMDALAQFYGWEAQA